MLEFILLRSQARVKTPNFWLFFAMLRGMKIGFGLFFLMLVSFLLRLFQANLNYTPVFGDEWVLSSASLNMMMTGALSNTFFGYGDVCKIPYLFIDMITFLVGVWRGIYTHVSEVVPFEHFVFANRMWNVTLGALSVGVGYRLGEKLYSASVGWVIALLIFANPLQFKYSLYTNPDATAFFFMLLSMVFALDIASEDRAKATKGYLFSAVCVALSVGAKVNHLFAILFPLVIHFYVKKGNGLEKIFNLNLLYFFGCLATTFFLVSPTALLSFPVYFDFWLRFFFAPEGHLGERQVYAASQFFLLFKEIYRILGGWVLFGFSCLGFLGLFQKKEHQVSAFLGLLLVLFFSTVIKAKTSYSVDAHALFPMLPFILIFTAVGINLAARACALFIPSLNIKSAAILFASLLILFPLSKSILNWKKDYTYFGANNKESFWRYLFTGKVPINPAPLNELSDAEKKALAQNEKKGPVTLKGVEDHWLLAQKISPLKNLNLEYRVASSSSLLPSLVCVTLSSIEEIEGRFFIRDRRRYLLFEAGEWNWRQKGGKVAIEKKENGDSLASIPVAPVRCAEFLLIDVQLQSPYATTEVTLNRVAS